MKMVLVVVQCMRQYTENSPGCRTAKYTNVAAGTTLHSPGSPFLPDEPTLTISVP